ncbi:hypothetical protein CDW55_08415 [Chryseobacterium sp. VAUSW3]|nr:hypothetical protein CDW55_08415 [Chryseobacterium sp. VAUSW3]
MFGAPSEKCGLIRSASEELPKNTRAITQETAFSFNSKKHEKTDAEFTSLKRRYTFVSILTPKI